MENKNVMVFVEQVNGKIVDVSLELISEAKRLSEKLNSSVTAVVLGHDMDDEIQKLGHYGCQKVYYVDDRRVSQFTSVPYSKAIVEVIKTHSPYIVLFGATTNGRDIAPRVSSELKCGLTADCTELQIGDHKIKDKEYKNILLQIRPAFGGNIIATIVSPESYPSMATVREGVMKLIDPDSSKKVEVEKQDIKLKDEYFLTEVLEVIRKEKSVNLKASPIVVSAGMGASDSDSFKLIKELAKTLGGVVGASRPVIDSGVLIRDHQVGQTGTTVRPNLYIACGISGQIQHRAGMSESKRIIAINNDPNAPIFNIAHYGIVGDVKDVIPKMIKAYRDKV